MGVHALLEELGALGVSLRVHGEDLEYEGPEEAITPRILERLRENKHRLISIISCETEGGRYRLLQRALSYLAGRYVEGADLSLLDAYEEAVEQLYADGTPEEFYLAVQKFVRTAVREFERTRERGRGKGREEGTT